MDFEITKTSTEEPFILKPQKEAAIECDTLLTLMEDDICKIVSEALSEKKLDNDKLLSCFGDDFDPIQDFLEGKGYKVTPPDEIADIEVYPKFNQMANKQIEEAIQACIDKFVDPLKIVEALEALSK